MSVQLTVDGRVAWLVLDRPDRLNATDDAMLDQMLDHLEFLGTDDATDLVVVTGAGRAFCAGGDLTRPKPSGSLDEQVAKLRRHTRSVELLRRLPQVTIAAVNGPCAGLGVGWAAACTLRVVADTAVFNTAYLSAGLSGDFGVAWLLQRLVGHGVAADWLLRPRKISADEAGTRGFATIVAPTATFTECVSDVLAEIAALKPAAVAGALANLREAERLPLGAYLDRESHRHVDVRTCR